MEAWIKTKFGFVPIIFLTGGLAYIVWLCLFMDVRGLHVSRIMLITFFIVFLVYLTINLYFSLITRKGYVHRLPATISRAIVSERFLPYMAQNGHTGEQVDDRPFRMLFFGKPYTFVIEGIWIIFFMPKSSITLGVFVSDRNEAIMTLIESFIEMEKK